MTVKIPVSIGELLDKISILKIKKHKISDKEKLYHVQQELDLLSKQLDDFDNDIVINYIQALLDVNTLLWNIEDNIRNKEKNKEFDEEFIELARSVYINNDKRAKIKQQINIETKSDIVEVKSYKDYE